jgi:hypothetical protein
MNKEEPENTASVSSQLLPAEEAEYYQQLQAKHFSDQAVGSRFTAETLTSLVDSNPQLLNDDDDLDKFLALGVDRQALLPDRRYFLLHAAGEEGLIAADNLEPQTVVEVVGAKAGSLSLAVRGPKRPRTKLATAIVGDYPADPSRRALITIFPGLPADPARSMVSEDNDFGLQSGQKIALAELQELLGRDDLLLQII